MKQLFLPFALLVFSQTLQAATDAKPVQRFHGELVCTPGETWRYSPAFLDTWKDTWKNEFQDFLYGKQSVTRGFSEALTLRKLANTDDIKAFAEYWISRALFQAKLPHIAHMGFLAIATRPPTPDTAGIQLAALACLNQIHEEYPTLAFNAATIENLDQLLPAATTAQDREVIWQTASTALRTELAASSPSAKSVHSLLGTLKSSGHYENLAKAFWEARQNSHAKAVTAFSAYFASPNIPKHLQKYTDMAHLVMARSYYALEKFDQAAQELKLVSRSSNELAQSITDLSWTYLMNERYGESIGAAMSLQAGGLRQTFAPEAPMVMAMAMNELCQFPESLKGINIFRKNYEKPYKWLDSWYKNGREPLYKEAIAFIRKKSTAPTRVASEWVRSSTFISHQDEINLLFKENKAAQELGRQGSSEQLKLGMKILQLAQDLKTRIKQERTKIGPDAELSSKTQNALLALRDHLTHYKRMRRAAPTWRTILTKHQKQAPNIEKKLMAAINNDLQDRSVRMLRELEEIAENNQLIEVEIFNGASQDIIWQNAHPDYKEVAAKLKKDTQAASAAKVWDWGRRPTSDDDEDGGEIWEDELGSFKADLLDNCSSKDKYLSLKRRF